MDPVVKKIKLENVSQLSEIEELRRENERLRQEKQSLEREKLEANRIKFQHIKKPHLSTDKLGANDIKEIIPAYDPSKNELDSRGWIEIVDNIRNIYEWSDRDTMFYASFRMEKAARTWYLGHGAGIIRWSEFKEKLIEIFPLRLPDRPHALTEMLPIKSKALAKQSPDEIQLSSTKIPEKTDKPEQKLSEEPKVSTQKITDKPIAKKLPNNSLVQKIPVKLEVLPENLPEKSEENKPAKKKNALSRMCYHCRESGHLARNCKNADKEISYQMRYVKSNSDSCGGLIKQVEIDKASVEAFLDLGSDTTTIKSLETSTYNWKAFPCNVKLIGIGGTSTTAIGRMIKSVNVGGVFVKNIEIYVVPNEFQEYPMILGRNFLNSPGVVVVKKFNSLDVMNANDIVKDVLSV